jgi:hypothetical protein
VTSREEAERLVGGVLATMRDLQTVLDEETRQVRAGRIRDGLAQEGRKGELTGTYLRSLEAVKANAIALARFAPDAVDRLKKAHAAFGLIVQANQTVVATARAVSESLIKNLSEEMNRSAQPQTYAPRGAPTSYAPRSEPLVVSKRL